MDVLNGQEVISEIARRLRAGFAESVFKEIYKDTPRQGFQPGCIFIHDVEDTHKNELRGYANWGFNIDIRCHPPKDVSATFTWGRGIAVRIIDMVNKLQISGQQVKASDIIWKVQDDVLHVICRYSFRVREIPVEVPVMQTLTYGERVKNS